MPSYLLDTDVIIDALSGKRGAADLFRRLLLEGHSLACCAVNLAEVLAGVRHAEERRVSRFLGSLEYYPITRTAACRAGLLKRDWARKGVALSTTDAMIAAVALEYNLTLVTRNVRHYPMPELRLRPTT